MCIERIKEFNKEYKKRINNFVSSAITGLISGVIIIIFFNLITDSTFNRRINLFNLGEAFAAGIYLLFTLSLLYVLFLFGRFVFKRCMSKKKEDLIGFRINYFAGTYSATFGAFLYGFRNSIYSMIIILILFLLIYVPTIYFAVRDNKNKK